MAQQVHQTKKANKFECKLCGEKQSIKRHYGLGTGKECRIHVQKLNGIRGEIDELNETSIDFDNNTDNEPNCVNPNLKHKPMKSKWSDFFEICDDAPEPGPSKPMHLNDAKVVLEIPKKRRNLGKERCSTNSKPTKSAYCNDIMSVKMESEVCKHNVSLPFSTKLHDTNDNLMYKSSFKSTLIKTESTQNKIRTPKKIVTPLINNSKWAQYTETKAEPEDKFNLNNSSEITVSENSENNDNFISKDDSTGDFNKNEIYSFCMKKNKNNLFQNLKVFQNDKEKPEYKKADMENNNNLGIFSKPYVKKHSKRAHFIDEGYANKEDICNSTENIGNIPGISKKAVTLFSLCDDSDLDKILDL